MLVAPGAVNLKNSRYRPVIKERGDNGRQHGNFCQRVGRASQPNYFTNMSPVDLHSRRLSRERRIFLATRFCVPTIPRSSISGSVQKLQLQRTVASSLPSPFFRLCFSRSLVPLLLLFFPLVLCSFLSDSVLLLLNAEFILRVLSSSRLFLSAFFPTSAFLSYLS